MVSVHGEVFLWCLLFACRVFYQCYTCMNGWYVSELVLVVTYGRTIMIDIISSDSRPACCFFVINMVSHFSDISNNSADEGGGLSIRSVTAPVVMQSTLARYALVSDACRFMCALTISLPLLVAFWGDCQL